MKIGFSGGRKGWIKPQRMVVASLFDSLQMTEFHHGDCVGSDEEAHVLVMRGALSPLIVIHPPIVPGNRANCWIRYSVGGIEVRLLPEKEYLDRNMDIVDATDILIATPNQMTEELRSGTWHAIRYARKLNRQIYIIYPDGTASVEVGTSRSSFARGDKIPVQPQSA